MHSHSRRSFLAQTLGASFFGASVLEQAVLRAAQARAQSITEGAVLFDLEKVTEGVYAAVARPTAQINCNAAIFENADDLMIVDTHSSPSAVAALVGQVRREITQKPIRYIVNTHFHADHVLGNPAYRRIAPHAEIVSSTVTRKLIAELDPGQLKRFLDGMPKALEGYRARLAAAKTPEEKAYYEGMVSQTRAYMSEMRDYAPELPNLTFQDNLVLHDKAHDLHLAFRGRGHTAGDIVVFCPQKKAIASGDLAHGFLPYVGDGYPREWPGTLKSVAQFDFTQVIGGHGPVQHGRDRMGQMTAYIEELVAAVEAGKREGRSIEELQRTVTTATLKSLGRDGYGEFVSASLMRYTPGPPDRTLAEILASGVKENVASTYRALERT
jgi:glyoxylase-like metal-dependent hydrolase (beta-lactamase superfamily II)